MKVGRTERIEIRLSRDLAARLTEGLRGRGAPQIEVIEIGDLMRVRLLGEHFAITALSSEDQLVRDIGFTQWDFDVVPRRSGRRVLRLAVTLRLKREDTQELCDLPALEREIAVHVAPFTQLRFLHAAIGNGSALQLPYLLVFGWRPKLILAPGPSPISRVLLTSCSSLEHSSEQKGYR
jgi:hypothetical protein